MSKLEREFDKAMMDIYSKAKSEADYHAKLFFDMLVQKRGLSTAKQLINSPKVSVGYTNLHLLGRLDLTVEAVVYENRKWHPLFSQDEIANCLKRLTEYKYSPREPK